MSSVQSVLINLILLSLATCEATINNTCTVKPSGVVGKCKLLTDCKQVRDEILTLNRLPSTCGFQETQPIVCCPPKPGTISSQKCKEYSSFATENGAQCHNIVKRIVGGTKATRKEFPHMALVGFEQTSGNISWECGGIIISENYVMTAAHCLRNRFLSGKASHVQVGVTNILDNDHKQTLKIATTIPHPQYQFPIRYHDIALLKLENSIEFNTYARPACLYYDSQNVFDNVIATGWGKTEYAGETSTDLLKVTLSIVENNVCNATYAKFVGEMLRDGIREDVHICAGSKNETKDTCAGDAGGPIQIYHTADDITCMYDIVGITSFGKGCFGGPSVYTRVSFYIKWIEDIVWSQ